MPNCKEKRSFRYLAMTIVKFAREELSKQFSWLLAGLAVAQRKKRSLDYLAMMIVNFAEEQLPTSVEVFYNLVSSTSKRE